jgi:lysophospholipase L1-like esterase
MLRDVSISRRIMAPFLLACTLLLASVAPVLAVSAVKLQKPVKPSQPNNAVLSQPLPITRYLALGDSLAFGFQPHGDHTHGYAHDLSTMLQSQGMTDHANLGCPRETTSTFITGGMCPYPSSSQLATALAYLRQPHAGQATLVTLDIGANDLLGNMTIDLQKQTCGVDENTFATNLQALDKHVTQTILPQLHDALKDPNGQITGTIMLLNYYDPFQNVCPNTLPFIQTLNTHLADDVKGFGTLVDIFAAFGGAATPNPHLCTYTWMCSAPPLGPDIHPTTTGYQIMASAIEEQGASESVNVLLGCLKGKKIKKCK